MPYTFHRPSIVKNTPALNALTSKGVREAENFNALTLGNAPEPTGQRPSVVRRYGSRVALLRQMRTQQAESGASPTQDGFIGAVSSLNQQAGIALMSSKRDGSQSRLHDAAEFGAELLVSHAGGGVIAALGSAGEGALNAMGSAGEGALNALGAVGEGALNVLGTVGEGAVHVLGAVGGVLEAVLNP